MEPERWRRIEALFDAALDLSPGERSAYLDRECGADTQLRADVTSLLVAHQANERGHSPIAGLVSKAARDASIDFAPGWTGRRIGPYEVKGVIGRGGMGLVLLAARADRDFDQRVAIKLLPGVANEEILARFRAERRILAGLHHPNIARLIDGGETGEGLPYLVMEFVDGVPIDRHCVEQGLPTRARLDLFRLVCAAVHDAHRHLVIHRDIKPGNILVTSEGLPKLLDFGIAKLLAEDPLAAGKPRTVTGMRALTPEYASPEQVRGEPVTTASDVYSLGVLLYELLTGRRPYRIDTRQPSEVERIVCETDPERPSTVVGRELELEERGAEATPPAGTGARATRPDRLRRELSGDLDNIVLMAMRKKPERRYASVEQLSEDIRNHLRGHPVIARADTRGYRVSWFVRRNRMLVGSTAAVFVALVSGLAFSVSQHREAVRQRLVAEERTREAQWEAYASAIAAGEVSIRMNQIGEAQSQLESVPETLRGWEWRHLTQRLDRSRYVVRAHTQGVTRIAFSPDGAAFATSSYDGTVGLWRTETGDSIRRWGPFPSKTESVAFHPDGALIAAGFRDGTIRVWAAGSGEERASLSGNNWAMVTFSPDGSKLLAAFQDGTATEWRTDSFQRTGTIDAGGEFLCAAYARRGRIIITGDGRGRVKTWDAGTRRLRKEFLAHGRRIMNLVVGADGETFATASMDRSVKVWRLSESAPMSVFRGHVASVAGIAFDGAMAHVISGGADRQILVWNIADGAILEELRGGGEDAYAVAVSPDGSWIVTGGWGGRVRLWSAHTSDVRTITIPSYDYMTCPVDHVAHSPDGRVVVSAAARLGVLDLWDAQSCTRIAELETGYAEFPTGVVFHVDGSRLYAADAGGHIVVFDSRTHERLAAIKAHRAAVLGIDVSPDGSVIASASMDSLICFWDANTLAPHGQPGRHQGPVTGVLYHRDGRLASCSADATIRFYTSSGDTLRVLRGHEGGVLDIAFSPDGTLLVSASTDESVRLWNVESGQVLGTVGSGRGRAGAACFTPDGTRVAIGGADQIVRIVDLISRREVARLHGHVGRILSLEPCPQRNGIVSTSFDGTIRFWDAE